MRIRRTKQVDMSPAAMAARLYDLASLYELGVSLGRARVLGPAEGQSPSDAPASPPGPPQKAGARDPDAADLAKTPSRG